jgi:hypothetical protein
MNWPVVVRIFVVYEIIGEPPLSGVIHVTLTSNPEIVVVGFIG